MFYLLVSLNKSNGQLDKTGLKRDTKNNNKSISIWPMINMNERQNIDSDISEFIFSLYPELSQIDQATWLKLIENSQEIGLPAHTYLQTLPGPYEHLLLVLEGQSRAYQVDENGREVTFYRNYPGDICPDNLRTLFNSKTNQYRIKSETPLVALQIPASAFHSAMQESNEFRQFIFCQISQNYSDLTVTLQESVFEKLDSRLCSLLKQLFHQSQQNTLKITHQNLANELGTTREVISRSLKLLEKQGCLKITRGQLTMVNPELLTNL